MSELRKIDSAEQIDYNMFFKGSDEALAPIICVDEFDLALMKGVWEDSVAIYKSILAGKAGASETYTQRTARDINTITKKIGEEACELVRAYTLENRDATAEESADLFYRMICLLSEAGIPPQELFKRIGERNKNK